MQTIRKYILGLLFVFMLVAALFIPAQAFAADPIEVDTEASLQIEFIVGEEPASDVEFRVYRVAEVNRAVEFTPVAPFDNYSLNLSEPTSDLYRAFATLLPGYIAADKIAPYAVARTGEDGIAKFENLETGLYLVVGDVYHGYREYVTPESFMICLPERLEDETWNYDVVCRVKYSSVPDADLIDIEVLKVWDDNNDSDRPSSVTVELYDGDVLFDTVVLNKGNNWAHRWTDLYGDTIWSVREAEVPDGYVVSVEKQEGRFVVTNTADEPLPETGGKLPQTGMLWWPVPVLAIAGLLLIALGVSKRKRSE